MHDRKTSGAPSKYWHVAVFSFIGFAIIATEIAIVLHLSLRPQPTHASISPPSSAAIPIVQATAPSSRNNRWITALLSANAKTESVQQYLHLDFAKRLSGGFFKPPGPFVVDANSFLAYKGGPIDIQEANPEANMHFNERDDGREIQVSAGQTFEIVLTETRTAGFRWIITSRGEPVCRVVNDSFDSPRTTPGQSGTHHWSFTVDTQGTAIIELAYRRQWQETLPPARTYTLRIRAGG